MLIFDTKPLNGLQRVAFLKRRFIRLILRLKAPWFADTALWFEFRAVPT
jgi:hypothetical protein